MIEVAPLAYMRGRTLNDAFIILDEAQNTTAEQMKMFLTRLGFGSKIVVTGDVTQVDLPGGARSGLRAASEILDGIDDIHFAELTSADVVRHRLVSDIVDAYERFEPSPRGDVNRAQRRRRPRQSADRRSAESDVMSIEVSNESGIDVSEDELISVARFVIAQMDVHPAAELSMVLVDIDTMADLHMRWMDLPGPTDVMWFPMDELEPGGRPDAPEPGPGDARRHRAVPGSSPPSRPPRPGTSARARAGAADRARRPAPARLRPRRAGGGEGDVRAAGADCSRSGCAEQVEALHQDRQTEKDRRLLGKSRRTSTNRDRTASAARAIALRRSSAACSRPSTRPSTRSPSPAWRRWSRDERPGAVRLARVVADGRAT